MGTNVTAEQRLAMYAYLLAGKTEFWRAHRHYAGIVHFVYLTCSYPGVYTADHFQDVTRLKLDPHFADYMGEAFKPLGVYIKFFQPALPTGGSREFTIMMVNDTYQPASGRLVLTLESRAGTVLSKAKLPYTVPELGDQTFQVPLLIPNQSGDCILKAAAIPDGKASDGATLSRRWVKLGR